MIDQLDLGALGFSGSVTYLYYSFVHARNSQGRGPNPTPRDAFRGSAGALGPEDGSEVRGPGISCPWVPSRGNNMPTKKSKTPSKDDYDELAIEFEQQKRQNEQTMMVLEAKDQELQQQGDT